MGKKGDKKNRNRSMICSKCGDLFKSDKIKAHMISRHP